MSNKRKMKVAEKAAVKIVLLAVPSLMENWHNEAPEKTFEQYMLDEYKKIKGEKENESKR